jgi:hypothetical protein
MKRSLLLLLTAFGSAPLTLGACIDTDPVPLDEIITIDVCPDHATPCDEIADGVSRLKVRVCVPPDKVPARASNLAATLQIPGGSWINPTDPGKAMLLVVPLAVDNCADAELVTSTTPGDFTLSAQIAGVTQTKTITLEPAHLSSIEVVPGDALEAGGKTGITMTARAVNGGMPSDGTTLSFDVMSPVSGVSFYPKTTVLKSNQATAQVLLDATAKAPFTFTFTVTGTPPPDSSGNTPAPLSSSVVLTAN